MNRSSIQRAIDDVAPLASRLYIGRTGHPERRLLQHVDEHGRPWLTILGWSEDRDELHRVEEALIAANAHRAKLENVSRTADGWHMGHGPHCLYLSWTLRHGARAPVRVRRLADTQLRPQTGLVGVVGHVHVALTVARAADRLRALGGPR